MKVLQIRGRIIGQNPKKERRAFGKPLASTIQADGNWLPAISFAKSASSICYSLTERH